MSQPPISRQPPHQPPRHPPRQYPPPRSVADLPDFSQPASGLPSVAVRKLAPVVKKPAVEPQLPPYRPVSNRLRGWIVLLTLVTAVGMAALMLRPLLQLRAAKAARADAAAMLACPSGDAHPAPGCPGSKLEVLVLPVPPAPGLRATP